MLMFVAKVTQNKENGGKNEQLGNETECFVKDREEIVSL